MPPLVQVRDVKVEPIASVTGKHHRAAKAHRSSFEAQNIGDDVCLLVGGEHDVGHYAMWRIERGR